MTEPVLRRSFVLAGRAVDRRDWRLELGRRTLLMGVLNLTPDSFSDGGSYLDPSRAAARAREMAAEGADIIDIGGESTRPGSEPVPVAEQLRRVLPVLERLGEDFRTPISIDTCRAEVAREACAAGAWIINDTSALGADPLMAAAAAEMQVPLVLMHMSGTPETMQRNPIYRDVVAEVSEFFLSRIQFALAAGTRKDMIILDPGIGFGKTLEHNMQLLANLPALAGLGFPLLVGPSRKSFIGTLTGRPVDCREWGTAGAVAGASWLGAHIIRVHEPGPMRDVLTVVEAMRDLIK